MGIPIHSINVIDGSLRSPFDFGRLQVGYQFAVAFPPSTNSLTALGAITAGTGFTSLPTIALTAGTGSGGAVIATSLKAVSATVVSGGTSGFVVGDLIVLGNGVVLVVASVSSGVVATATVSPTQINPITVGVAAQTQVSTSGAGVGITTWTIVYGLGAAVITNSGNYTVTPTGATVTGGGGSGASLAAPVLGGTAGTVSIPVTFSEGLPSQYMVTCQANVPCADGAINKTPYGFTLQLTAPTGATLNGGLVDIKIEG